MGPTTRRAHGHHHAGRSGAQSHHAGMALQRAQQRAGLGGSLGGASEPFKQAHLLTGKCPITDGNGPRRKVVVVRKDGLAGSGLGSALSLMGRGL